MLHYCLLIEMKIKSDDDDDDDDDDWGTCSLTSSNNSCSPHFTAAPSLYLYLVFHSLALCKRMKSVKGVLSRLESTKTKSFILSAELYPGLLGCLGRYPLTASRPGMPTP